MKRVYRKIAGIFICVFFLVMLVSVAFAADAKVVINLGQYQTGEDFPGYRIAEYFVKKVDELSQGRIQVKHFPGDLLGDWETQEVHVKEGSLDMCFAPATAAFDPEMEFVRVPYLVYSWDGVKRLFTGGGEGEKLLMEICQRNNTYCIGVAPEGFSVIVSTKEFTPLPKHPSVRSIKTRVMPAKLEEITGKALGFMTLSMPWGEIHSALMLGTIDAAMGPVYGEVTLFKDVVKYMYNYNYGFYAAPWIFNLDRWNSLSEEDRNILLAAFEEAKNIEWERAIETQENAIEQMKAAGVKVIDLTDEQMAANVKVCREEVWDWAAENMFSKEFMDKIRSMAEEISQ